MGIGEWLAQNWFDLITNIGTIGGLFFAAFSIYEDVKARRVANLLTLTQNHRELMKVFYRDTDLARVLDASASVSKQPITLAENAYVTVMIQHLSGVYRAMRTDLTIKPEAMRLDVRAFFLLPLPKTVWERTKEFQDRDFAAFVDSCLN